MSLSENYQIANEPQFANCGKFAISFPVNRKFEVIMDGNKRNEQKERRMVVRRPHISRIYIFLKKDSISAVLILPLCKDAFLKSR